MFLPNGKKLEWFDFHSLSEKKEDGDDKKNHMYELCEDIEMLLNVLRKQFQLHNLKTCVF